MTLTIKQEGNLTIIIYCVKFDLANLISHQFKPKASILSLMKVVNQTLVQYTFPVKE